MKSGENPVVMEDTQRLEEFQDADGEEIQIIVQSARDSVRIKFQKFFLIYHTFFFLLQDFVEVIFQVSTGGEETAHFPSSMTLKELLDHFKLSIDEILVNKSPAADHEILSSFSQPVHIFIEVSFFFKLREFWFASLIS